MKVYEKVSEIFNRHALAGVEPFALEFVYRERHGLTKLNWVNLLRENATPEMLSELTEISNRLMAHEPPQYIVGSAIFCDLRFKVDARVLIPRPETEELVHLILAENKTELPLNVLDIGTGSGAIAVSLATARPTWQLTASDISAVALDLAQENAASNLTEIDFVLSDVFDALTGKFDLIVSNPPYIDPADVAEVDLSVDGHEPHGALYAGNHGLAIYEKIARGARQHLTENGKLYLEIGYKQGTAVKKLFEAAFPEKIVRVHQDFAGKDRMVSVR
ncbi:MAG: peptide chain release factor N(5)-glutamine methyltransferase [Streptococcaceae bacterium]|jgi:release factor glutamine methyltransferase|nr:peptide chain release factor N(5)-glutamine methyltransferase [Streptococcaceae bacterium]